MEKKVRQLLDLVDSLRQKEPVATAKPADGSYEDLPLLKGLTRTERDDELSRLLRERREVRERIRLLREQIEQVLGR